MAASIFDIDTTIEEKQVEHRRKPFFEVLLSGNEIDRLMQSRGFGLFFGLSLHGCGLVYVIFSRG